MIFRAHMKNSKVKLKHKIFPEPSYNQFLQVKHDPKPLQEISVWMPAGLLFEPVSSQQSIVSLVKKVD